MLREQHHLPNLILISNLYIDQQPLQIIKQLDVLGVLEFEFHVVVVDGDVVGLAVRAEFLLYF